MAISNVDSRSDTCRAGASDARHLRPTFNRLIGIPLNLSMSRPIDFRLDNDCFPGDIWRKIEKLAVFLIRDRE